MMYKRILVAVDGSENSKRAAEHALQIATLHAGATVEVLYVVDYDRIRRDATPKSQKTNEDKLHVDRENRLSPIKGVFEQSKVNYEIIIKNGDPGTTIVSFANRGGFDLVIIGSRGLNSFQEMVLGSVSHKVAKRTKAPVMIIK